MDTEEHSEIIVKVPSEILMCSICFERYDKPRMLPCQHTFCLACLKDYINVRHLDYTLDCPICKTEHELFANGAENFRPNLLIQSILDSDSKDNVKTNIVDINVDIPECGLCNHRSMGLFCLDCKEWLCKRCSKVHRRWPAENHTLLTITQMCQKLKVDKNEPRVCLTRLDDQIMLSDEDDDTNEEEAVTRLDDQIMESDEDDDENEEEAVSLYESESMIIDKRRYSDLDLYKPPVVRINLTTIEVLMRGRYIEIDKSEEICVLLNEVSNVTKLHLMDLCLVKNGEEQLSFSSTITSSVRTSDIIEFSTTQWVEEVLGCSSQHKDRATNLVGRPLKFPPTSVCDEEAHTWAPESNTGLKHWVEMSYNAAVRPTQIIVYQSYGVCCLEQISAKHQNGKYTTLWKRPASDIPLCNVYKFETSVKPLGKKTRINILRLEFNTALSEKQQKLKIHSVELRGTL